MKILLTGASGFLGSALARRLHAAGHALVLPLRPSSSITRLAGIDVDIVQCASDAEASALVQRVRPEAIVHTACSYGRHGESVLKLVDANVRFGLALLQGLVESGGKAAPCNFVNTGTALPSNASLYALAKHQFAQWGGALATTRPDRLRFVNVQLQHMYGPGDAPSKFTTHVVHTCHSNALELPLTAGEQRRDFIYLDDVLDAYETLLPRADSLEPACDLPLGSGEAPTIRMFVETVHRLCRSSTRLQFGAIPYRPGEAMECRADLGPMARLGWAPRWTLAAGLAKTLELEFPP